MRSMPTTPGRPRSVSTPTWNATASSSPTRPPSTASSTRSSPGTDPAAAGPPDTDLRIGCSGWNYASWRASFYPPRTPASRWLEHYARVFDTVEVNSTFYRLAQREAGGRWGDQTPPDLIL